MATAQPEAQSYEFKAETQRLLDILIHSVYTSKDIFLRELISNASDALEKVRFRKVRGEAVHEPDRELEIRIDFEEKDGRKILVVADSGIGMTDEEVRTNLGTIAHSGASAFLESLAKEDSKDLSLIGRFGVGFYAVFMVAERVVVESRSAVEDAAPVRWESDGTGTFTVSAIDEARPRGTRIEVWLKPDEERFFEKSTIESAIRKYSNFVPFPILVSGERVNRTTAVWREPPAQVTAEQYAEFYRFISHDAQDPLARLHVSVDAPLQFSALLFVPRTDLEVLGFGSREVSVELYVKRVLIDPENKHVLPRYLRFVRGVVESEDLPLNISRESLQENALVHKIRDVLARRLLDHLLEIAKKEPETYAEIWRTFGRILKEGYADYSNRERFLDLLRFNASFHDDAKQLASLADYVEAMPAGQKAIYYLTAPSREAIVRDPRLELFRKKGIPVLYLYEPADEFVLGSLASFRDLPLVSAESVKPADVADLGKTAESDATKSDAKTSETSAEPSAEIERLLERFREVLGDRVTKVVVSERLVDSPVCLVSDDDNVSSHLDKMMRLYHKDAELPKRIFEIHPDHPMIRSLARLEARSPKDPFVANACEQLWESYMLLDGYLTDPHRLVERVNDILSQAAVAKAGSESEGS